MTVFNRIWVSTATTSTGSVTTGSAVSNAFLSFLNANAGAAVPNGTTVTYEINDGLNFELGQGVYSAGVLTRATVYISSIAGTVGTTKLNLSGNATVQVVIPKEEAPLLSAAQTFAAAQTFSVAPVFTDKPGSRGAMYAAPFDAMAFNNLALNARADVCQRLGTPGSFPGLVSGTAKYGTDLWEFQYVHGANTAFMQYGQSNIATAFGAPVGFYNAHFLTSTTALSSPANGDYALIRHKVEGIRIIPLNWGSANAVPLAYAFMFYSANAGVTFFKISNSAKNRCYYVEVTLASGWNFVSGSIVGDQSGTWLNGVGVIGLQIEFFGSGKAASPVAPGAWTATNTTQTTNSVSLMGTNGAAILVVGAFFVADNGQQLPTQADLPNVMRAFDQELFACLRGYRKSFPYAILVGQASGRTGTISVKNPIALGDPSVFVQFNPPMMKTPTIVTYNPDLNNANWRDTTAGSDVTVSVDPGATVSESGVLIATSGTVATLGDILGIHYTAEAAL